MNPVKSKIVYLLIGLTGLFMATSVLAESEEVVKNFIVDKAGVLSISSDIGSIDVQVWDKSEVLVEVKKEARSESRLEKFSLSFDQKGSDIFVVGDGRFNSRVSVWFSVKVPRKFDLDLKTGGGTIDIGDLSGEIKVHTSGGGIEIGNVARGSVDASTSGGSIRVGDVNGDLEVDTSGGNIRIGKVTGTSLIDTSGGSIRLAEGGNNVEANTSGGSIHIGPVNGTVDVDTSGGSIHIGLAQNDVKARTSGGSINVEGSLGSVDVDTSGGGIFVGSSNGSVIAVTSGGSIKISKASGSIEAETAGGAIEAEMITADRDDTHVELESAGGTLTLYIPKNLAASVNANIRITRSARRDYNIYSDFPLTLKGEHTGRVSGTGDINGGGDSIDLRTVNGDIHIKMLGT